jgi:hypothetical protein
VRIVVLLLYFHNILYMCKVKCLLAFCKMYKLSNMIRINHPVGISVVIIGDDSETLCILELGQVTDTITFWILMVTEEKVNYWHRKHAVFHSHFSSKFCGYFD